MKKINSKKKGSRTELELVKILEERFGKGRFKRTPQSGAHVGGKNQEGATNLPFEAKITLVSDLIVPVDFRFVIEHKSYKEASFWDLFNEWSDLHDWLLQVEDDAKFVDREPMLIVKYNRKKRITYTKRKSRFPGYIFKHNGWYCYLLKPLLEQNDSFWFRVNSDEV